MPRPTTYDIEREPYMTEYVVYDTSATHWSNSEEWLAYLAAKEKAYPRFASTSPFKMDQDKMVEDDPDVKATLAAFLAVYPPQSEGEPTPVVDARTLAMRNAELALQQAVQNIRVFAHTDRVLALVRTYCEQ